MKLRVRKYSRGCRGMVPPTKMISRSIVMCFGDSFSHLFYVNFNRLARFF